MNQNYRDFFTLRYLETADILLSNHQVQTYAMHCNFKKHFLFESLCLLEPDTLLYIIIELFDTSVWSPQIQDDRGNIYGNQLFHEYFTLYFRYYPNQYNPETFATFVFHVDSMEQKIFSLREYSFSAKMLLQKHPTISEFSYTFFTMLLGYLYARNCNFIVDSVPDSQDPNAPAYQLFFKEHILTKSYKFLPASTQDRSFVFRPISNQYPTFYEISFNTVKIAFRIPTSIPNDPTQSNSTPFHPSRSLNKYINPDFTTTSNTTPIPHANIILYSNPFANLPPRYTKETALSLINKYQPTTTPQYPSFSSNIRSKTDTRIMNTDYSTITNADEWNRFIKSFPKYIESEITKVIVGKNDLKDRVKLAEPIFQKYQIAIHDRENKQLDKLKSYLTTPSSPNVDIKQDKKGLVYSIVIPTNVPNRFISNAGKLTTPNGYHSLTPAEKFNELTTLQLRMNNFHEIIHHDLLLLANNPFFGKLYSPSNTTKSYTAEEILQICLNTATHPDEWQLTGRKILALHLENPGNKIPTVQMFLRNATASTGSKIDYRFPDDFISKLYYTTVSNSRLRYMLTDHVGSSLSSILGKRVTGSLMLLWLYAPLLTDHSSESSINERAGFLTYLYPPDSLKDVLKDVRQYNIPEVELLPSYDEYSLKYRFPLQKLKRELSNSSHEITSIWQNIRVLLCGIAYLTNSTVIQTKISNKATDLYSEIYYSAFKILQDKIAIESPSSTTVPCSLTSLLMFSAEDPIIPKIWSQWLQFFMILITNSRQFIKPSTLKDMLKNLYTNYPRFKRGTTIKPAQNLPQHQPLPPPTSTNDNTIVNDDDTLDAIALGLTEIEELSPTISDSSPSIGYEWKPTLRGIINYEKKNTLLNFGANETYSSTNAFMSMFFVNTLNDIWQTYTYNYNKSNKYGTTISTGIDLLYFDLIEKGLTQISEQSQLDSLKQAFQHGQPLSFPPLSNTEHRFNFSSLTLSPNDVLGIVLKLPKTPTPHNDSDWQFTYFQLAGVNPLSVLLSERQSDDTLHHRKFQFPTLRWSRPSKDNLPTFHFGQDYVKYSNITLDEQEQILTTPPATRSVKKQQLKPTEIVVPFKYHISIDQGVRNPISFKIRKLPKTIDTQTLDVTTLDGTLRKESVRETLGSGFIGHATPKGSTASEPALLTAKDGIILTISSTRVDVLSRGIIENKTSTPQTTDTNAASVVSFDIAASTQNLDHGKIQYKYVNQSLPHSQVLPQVSGYILRNVLDKNGKKQDNSKDHPKSKPEVWLYHLIRIQARLDDRYIDICSKQQLLALLMELYKFVKPSNQKLSWLKSSFIRSKVKEYLFIHQNDSFLQQFSVSQLSNYIKSNTISNLKSVIDRLWLRERFARVEFTKLLMKLFKHEVFESGMLPPNTTFNDVLLGLEDLRGYHPKKSNKKKYATPDPFWTALKKDFQNSTGDPKKDFFRSLWLNKAQDLDNYKTTSRKNSLWSHGLLKSYFQTFFTKHNIVYINPYKTSLECMFCGEEGIRKGEVFACNNMLCEKYQKPVNADSNSNPNIEVRSLQKYLEQLANNATPASSDLTNI